MPRRLLTSAEVVWLRREWPIRAKRIHTCERCGRWFLAAEHDRGVTKYCSRECAAAIKADRRRDPTARQRKTGWRVGETGWRVPHQCESCGRQFWSRRRDARFCSSTCRVAAHRARSSTD